MFFPGGKLTTVLFDFDGTLVDSETVHAGIWQKLLIDYGRPDETWSPEFAGLPAHGIAHTLFKDRHTATQVHELFEARELTHDYGWMKGAKEFVKFLHAQGYQIAVVTNSRREKVENFLNREGMQGLFSFIVSCEGAKLKPDPELYHRAILKSGKTAETIIAVEDSKTGAEAARRAGLRCVEVQPGEHYFLDTWKQLLAEKAQLAEQDDFDEQAATLWDFNLVRETVVPCDVIVGLGSYDVLIAQECVRLLTAGLATKIIFSGKHGNWTKGKLAATEADYFREIAEAAGAPRSSIILEKEATNIGQNILFSKKILDDHGWKTAIFVTKPQTTLRARLTINKQAQLERTIVTSPKRTLKESIAAFGRKQLFNEMVGDVDRIIRYPDLGFQEAIPVPTKVMQAFGTLKKYGFTEHLMS